MKHILILIFAYLCISISSYGQFYVKKDSLNEVAPNKLINKNTNRRDSLINHFLRQKKDDIISSLFGPSKKLSNADSLINAFDELPSFGIYKDNYIALGTEMFHKPTKSNSDAKFQISIRQRLTNSTLPFKTYLFLTYTQKAFWDVFEDSFPFRDLNFNPTLGVGKAIVHNNRLFGNLSFQLEHESNGKDSIASRSWNKISFTSNLIFNDNWTMHTKLWIPIVDSENNRDIVHYNGWGHIGIEYFSMKRKYSASCLITKRGGANLNANIVLNFALRLFSDDNQYLFLEYYNGYGEYLLGYNEYRQRIRIGLVIKPDIFFSF